MAELRRTRFRLIRCTLLVAGAILALRMSAQDPALRAVHVAEGQSGALSGKLTGLHSEPLGGISITLRNRTTGAEVHTVTAKNGGFRIAVLDSGEYELEADEARLGHGELAGIIVLSGVESHLQAAVKMAPPAPEPLEAGIPSQIDHAGLMPHALALGARPLDPIPLPQQPPAMLVAFQQTAPPALAPVASLALIEEHPLRGLSTSAHALEASATATDASLPPEPQQLAQPAAVRRPELTQRAALETASLLVQPSLAVAAPASLALQPLHPAPAHPFASSIDFASTIAAIDFTLLTQSNPELSSVVNPATATVIDAQQLQALPIRSRDWQQFLSDTSGDSLNPDVSSTADAGISRDPLQATLDPVGTKLAFGLSAGIASRSAELDPSSDAADQSALGAVARGGTHALAISETAVRAIRGVVDNSEFKRDSPIGSLAVETEDGRGPLHGQFFLYDRQNAWGARNPYTQWVQNLGTAAIPAYSPEPFTPPDQELILGLGLGSRILRNKLFWFGAVDSYRRDDPGVASVRNAAEFFNLPEPTSSSIQLLSAQLGESQNQAYRDFLGIAQAGYAPAGLAQLAGLLGPAQRTAAQVTSFLRLDWQAGERNTLSLEATSSQWNSPGGGLTRVSENYGNHSFGASNASQQTLTARWQTFLTSNLLAVTQASLGRSIFTARPDTPSAFEQSFLNGNFWGQLPQIVVDSRYGLTIGNPARFGQGSYPSETVLHAQQDVRWVHGKLLANAGASLDRNADEIGALRNQTGTYHYATVAGFISDALAFQKFGFADALDPANPHNCGATRTRFGSQPCYSYYTQTMGPSDWNVSTNQWSAYISAQSQPAHSVVLSAGLRWEHEQLPPPIAALANYDLPLTNKLPALGNNWGPRFSLSIGHAHSALPVLRLGYGMYFSRVPNATVLTALTQTGSLRSDLNFFLRPSDDCQHCAGGAPPFPYVFAGPPASTVKPGAVEFAPNFRNPEVHQAAASIEQPLPAHLKLTASAELSLARRLPIAVDTNIDPSVNPGTITYAVQDVTGSGPIKTPQITVPFYASWPSPTGALGRLNPNYQQIFELSGRANSTYEAAVVRLVRQSPRGLSLFLRYTYAHAMDWNPNESALISGSDVFDPANFSAEYGVSDLDQRHSAAASVVFAAPWRLRHAAGVIGNGWSLSGTGQFHSGLPYSMHTTGSIPEEFTATGTAIAGLGPDMNGFGGDNRVYGVGRNTFRYPNAWKADMRVSKRIPIGESHQLEIFAESFNFLNHSNVTRLESNGYMIESGGSNGTRPVLCYITMNTTTDSYGCGTTTTLSGAVSPLAAFGRPIDVNATDFYRERQIQLGLRFRF